MLRLPFLQTISNLNFRTCLYSSGRTRIGTKTRMDAPPARNPIYTRISAEQIFMRVMQAGLLFVFWAHVEKYEETTVSFQALLLITDLYRISLDKANSILLLSFILIVVNMVFSTKSFFPCVLAMTISSIFLVPVDMFYWYMLMKSFGDVLVFIFLWRDVRLIRTHMSSYCTDFLWLAFTMAYQLKYSIENRASCSVDDLFLVPIFVFHIFVFYLNLYSSTYLCYAINITGIWMFLKSSSHPRIRNLLALDINSVE